MISGAVVATRTAVKPVRSIVRRRSGRDKLVTNRSLASRDGRPSPASRVNSLASLVRVSLARASLASPVSRLRSGRLPFQRPGGSSARGASLFHRQAEYAPGVSPERVPLQLQRLDHFGVDVADLARAGLLHRDSRHDCPDASARPGSAPLRRRRLRAVLSRAVRRADENESRTPWARLITLFGSGRADLDRARTLFVDLGVPHHAPIDWGDHDCFYFLDPDGNLLELVAYR